MERSRINRDRAISRHEPPHYLASASVRTMGASWVGIEDGTPIGSNKGARGHARAVSSSDPSRLQLQDPYSGDSTKCRSRVELGGMHHDTIYKAGPSQGRNPASDLRFWLVHS